MFCFWCLWLPAGTHLTHVPVSSCVGADREDGREEAPYRLRPQQHQIARLINFPVSLRPVTINSSPSGHKLRDDTSVIPGKYTRTHTHTHTRMSENIHSNKPVFTHTHTHLYSHAHIYIDARTNLCTHIFTVLIYKKISTCIILGA